MTMVLLNGANLMPLWITLGVIGGALAAWILWNLGHVWVEYFRDRSKQQ